jgi:hypothetical protein
MTIVQQFREVVGNNAVVDGSGEQLLLRITRQVGPNFQHGVAEQRRERVLMGGRRLVARRKLALRQPKFLLRRDACGSDCIRPGSTSCQAAAFLRESAIAEEFGHNLFSQANEAVFRAHR